MTNIIYGVDADLDVTPKDVRDAIISCFTGAHAEILNEMMKNAKPPLTEEDVEALKKMNIEMLVRTFFEKVKGDYENPTKDSLVLVIGKLKEFAENFRAGDIIDKHAQEIMILMGKLK